MPHLPATALSPACREEEPARPPRPDAVPLRPHAPRHNGGNSARLRTRLAGAILAACATGFLAHAQFPPRSEAPATAGELICRPGQYKKFGAEYCLLAVPESRAGANARMIHIPVVRVKAARALSQEPVFYLFGGPGASNVAGHELLDWFYEDFDAVYIGYRGVDGSVSLDCPEFSAKLTDNDLLSTEGLRGLGAALRACFERHARNGVDLAGYNVLEVVDDLEAARKALGYGRVNVWAHSYGATLAYVLARRHPGSLSRMLLLGASSPRRVAAWDPRMIDQQLRYYAALWSKDAEASRRAPDLIAVIRRVLSGLPRDWQGARIDRDRVRIGFFLMLYNRATAAMAFDAIVRADGGDWSGLAAISAQVAAVKSLNACDAVLKLAGYVYEPGRDYEQAMDPPDAILGSPLGKMTWASLRASGWEAPMLPREWRRNAKTGVETLMVHGTVDVSSPPDYARRELLPMLTNGKFILLDELGHNDVIVNQPDAFRRLMEEFFTQGNVDRSFFKSAPMDFRAPRPLGPSKR